MIYKITTRNIDKILESAQKLVSGLSESDELKTLLNLIIKRHLNTLLGVEKFLAGFEKNLPKGISFEDLISIKHIRTTTPHPTEFMNPDAVKALKILGSVLENAATGSPQIAEIQAAIGALAKELKEKPRKKKIERETTDTLLGSEALYNSHEIMAEYIFQAAAKRRLIKLKGDRIAPEDLRKCKGMTEVRTWAPGDSDGKPAEDYNEFEHGIRRNVEAIYRQYIIKLATITSHLDESPAKTNATELLQKTIKTMVERSKEKGRQGKNDAIMKLLEHLGKAGVQNGEEKIIDVAIATYSKVDAYKNFDDLVEDLYSLKEFEEKGTRFTKKNAQNKLTELDQLIRSSQDFGGQAQKIEFRQNADIFRKVAARIKTIHGNKASIKSEIEKILSGHDVNLYNSVRDRLNGGGEVSDAEREEFYFIDTLKKLQIVAQNPDSFKSILIAECGEAGPKDHSKGDVASSQSIQDFNDTKFLFDIMTHGLPNADKIRKGIKITPLFEYNEQIEELPIFVEKLLADEDALKYYQKNGMEIMVAGSDSFKSATSSVTSPMAESIKTLEKLCENRGLNITLYYGTGSAVGRNIINIKHGLPFLRTVQGIEMRQPAGVFATEFLRVTSNRLRLFKNQQRNDLRFPEAFADIGNSSAAAENTESEAHPRHRANQRRKEYQEKYNSKSFGVFVDECLPNKIDSDHSIGARPAGRVGGSVSKGPTAKRAIGYGQIFNNAGWCAPQLFMDLSDLFTPENGGYLNLNSLRSAYKTYMGKGNFRDTVNRGVEALALSEPDIGWQYVAKRFGLEIKVERNYADFAKIKINGEDFTISNLLTQGTSGIVGLNKHVAESVKDESQQTNAINSVYSAITLEFEHQKSLRAVYQTLSYGLYKHITDNKIILKPADKESMPPLVAQMLKTKGQNAEYRKSISPEDLVELAKVINKTRGEELEKNAEAAKIARATLLDSFGKQTVKEPISKEQQQRTFSAYGILRTIFELPPVAFLFPELSQTQTHGKTRAA